MSVLVAVVRLVLAGVFVVSAIAKFRDRAGSREAVVAFGVPQPLVSLIAVSLPVVELACAALLLVGDPGATIGALAAIAMLVAFTMAIIWNLVRGRRPECHCFGSLGGGSGIGWSTVARNVVLLTLAAVSLVGAGELRSVPATLAELSATEGALLAVGAVLVGVLAAMAMALRTVIHRYGAVLLRLEAIEQATGIAPPKPAPAFALPDLDGATVTLDDVLEDGRPALLAFVSPTCHNCTELLPDLAGWQSDPDHPLSVVVISDGTVAANREKIADVGPLRVLLQDGLTVSDAYEIQGTPGAVVVGTDGRIAGSPMHAVGGVRGLHDSILRTMAAGPGSPNGHQHVHQIEQRPVSSGDPAPEMTLRTEDGTEVDLEAALGEESVLLFWRTDCGFCQRILDEVRDLEGTAPVRIITGSGLAALRESGLTSPVLRDESGKLNAWLHVPGTPSAARVSHGVLDSDVVVGGPDVLALLRASAPSPAAIE